MQFDANRMMACQHPPRKSWRPHHWVPAAGEKLCRAHVGRIACLLRGALLLSYTISLYHLIRDRVGLTRYGFQLVQGLCKMARAKVDDLYGELGLALGADAEGIRKAYRKLALKYHPDRTKGDESKTKRFIAIKEAYAVLGDDKLRLAHDKKLSDQLVKEARVVAPNLFFARPPPRFGQYRLTKK